MTTIVVAPARKTTAVVAAAAANPPFFHPPAGTAMLYRPIPFCPDMDMACEKDRFHAKRSSDSFSGREKYRDLAKIRGKALIICPIDSNLWNGIINRCMRHQESFIRHESISCPSRMAFLEASP